MQLATAIIGEIMDNADFAEVMFLVGFILFIVEFVRILALSRGEQTWGYHWILVVAGLACLALGFLALPTDVATP